MPHIPKPFQRPGLDLDAHVRQWVTIPAKDIVPGDILPDFGKVESGEFRRTEDVFSRTTEITVRLVSITGKVIYRDADEMTFVFH